MDLTRETMERKEDSVSNPFASAMCLDQLGVSSIPQRYVLPPSQRPSPHVPISTTLPIIDLSNLRDESLICLSPSMKFELPARRLVYFTYSTCSIYIPCNFFSPTLITCTFS